MIPSAPESKAICALFVTRFSTVPFLIKDLSRSSLFKLVSKVTARIFSLLFLFPFIAAFITWGSPWTVRKSISNWDNPCTAFSIVLPMSNNLRSINTRLP